MRDGLSVVPVLVALVVFGLLFAAGAWIDGQVYQQTGLLP